MDEKNVFKRLVDEDDVLGKAARLLSIALAVYLIAVVAWPWGWQDSSKWLMFTRFENLIKSCSAQDGVVTAWWNDSIGDVQYRCDQKFSAWYNQSLPGGG